MSKLLPALALTSFAGLALVACSDKSGAENTGPATPPSTTQPAAPTAPATPTNTDTAAANATPPSTPQAGATATAGDPKAEAETIFTQRCAVCHGVTGKGDGPGAAALNPKPRDYSDVAWQKTVDDAYIAKVIVEGGQAVGKSPLMVANADLKDKPEVVKALVAKVRSFAGGAAGGEGGAGGAAGGTGGAGGTAPAPTK